MIEMVGGPDDGMILEHFDADVEYIWTDGVPGHVMIFVDTEHLRPCYRRDDKKYRFVGYNAGESSDGSRLQNRDRRIK